MKNEEIIIDTTVEQATTVIACNHCQKVPIIIKHVPPSGQDNFNAVCDCKKTPLIYGANAAEKVKNEWESKYHAMSPIEVNKESGWENNTLYYETELKACTSCGKIPEEYKHCEGGGSVYYNVMCACKKTPLNRGTMGADTNSWNKKWFETDPKIVNEKAGYWSENPREFHYYT